MLFQKEFADPIYFVCILVFLAELTKLQRTHKIFYNILKLLIFFSIVINCYMFVMSNSTQTRQRISGNVDFKSNGLIYINYTELTPDTKCASNEGCTKSPGYASKCLSIFLFEISQCTSMKTTLSLTWVTTEQTGVQISEQCSNFFLHTGNDILSSWRQPKQRTHDVMSSQLTRRLYRIATNTKENPKHIGDLPVPETLCPPSWHMKWHEVEPLNYGVTEQSSYFYNNK
jgi:hypothetical protein